MTLKRMLTIQVMKLLDKLYQGENYVYITEINYIRHLTYAYTIPAPDRTNRRII